MDGATAARIREWDDRPVAGGYDGLRELADGGFTGAVTNGTAWLFLLNGRIVGTADGAVESFEGVDATAYRAPDPGLPLLYAMQDAGGEPRARYYTDDNPLREVHETLAEAGFTGYVELSENVLSGDYYVVYYGGKSMSLAFVGNAERLLTGDEAFREAADEVGIYQVVDVELDVRNVPEPAEGASAGAAAVAEAPDDEPTVEDEPPDTPSEADMSTDEPEPGASPDAEPEPEPEPAAEPEPEPADADSPPAEADPAPAADAEPEPAAEAAPQEPTTEAEEPTTPTGAEAESSGDEDPFSEEAAWRETRTIPALDPEESETPQAAEDGGQQASPPPTPEPESEPEQPAVEEPAPEPAQPSGGGAPPDGRIDELEAAIEAQNETIAELEQRLESSSSEAQQLREEREALESELEATRAGGETASAPAAGRTLDPDTALDQTDLFVRYGSKGGGTLEKAHDDKIDAEEVLNNLRIDHHTRFEEDEVTIDGEGFHGFLESSLEYRFVDWLVTQFLFEIQDTGSQRGLREVFDAIPRIDRVEFKGTVTWRDPEAGETHSEGFDVVCRDRMGQALIVANLNDVRDPATGEMMETLIDGSTTIAEGTETLGGAFLVTSSFFRPDALETASEATGGGLLSREKRWSYVKLARRAGYHLCLIEARGDDFHVAVPEL